MWKLQKLTHPQPLEWEWKNTMLFGRPFYSLEIPYWKTEGIYAIKNRKKGKAVGPDQITTELIKLIDEDNVNILVELFNVIYKTGIIPTEWLKSTFVALPKVNRPTRCEDYRTISLMSHMLKIFLKIIHDRIHRKWEMALTNTQFDFRNGIGTREALFGVNVLLQRCRDVSKDVYYRVHRLQKSLRQSTSQ